MCKPIFVPFKRTGYSHPKCYLSSTKGCATKISGEHCISEYLLNIIEKQNKTIDICGLSWLPKEKLRSIGKSRLKSNILCTVHNSALAGLDTEIGEFVQAIGSIDDEFKKDAPASRIYRIDGTHIERWVLKTVVGLVESGQIRKKSGDAFIYKDKCIKLLCSPRERWPLGWGLYTVTQGKIYHSSSFELLPQHNQGNGELLALGLKFNGIEMNFLMGKPGSGHNYGVHRPSKYVFEKKGIKSEIHFSWKTHKVGQYISFVHSGTYSGVAPGQDLPSA